MGRGYHLYPDGKGFPVSGRHHRLGQPGGTGLAAIEYDGYGILPRRPRDALARFGKPDIFNTDQGAQFTSGDFTGRLTAPASAFRWTAAAAGWTTFSLSGCGAR